MEATQPTPPHRWFIIILFLVMCVCILLFTTKCEKPIEPSGSIKKELIKRDSFRTIVLYRDSVRVKHVHHWNKIKLNPDSLPCDTFVKLVISKCDTVIKYDSLQIVALNNLVRQDSTIIGRLLDDKLQDSLSITKLNRKLKTQKMFTKISFVGGILIGGAVGIKLN